MRLEKWINERPIRAYNVFKALWMIAFAGVTYACASADLDGCAIVAAGCFGYVLGASTERLFGVTGED